MSTSIMPFPDILLEKSCVDLLMRIWLSFNIVFPSSLIFGSIKVKSLWLIIFFEELLSSKMLFSIMQNFPPLNTMDSPTLLLMKPPLKIAKLDSAPLLLKMFSAVLPLKFELKDFN